MNYGNGQKVSILPEFEPEPIEVKVNLTHDENGCLDFDNVGKCRPRALGASAATAARSQTR